MHYTSKPNLWVGAYGSNPIDPSELVLVKASSYNNLLGVAHRNDLSLIFVRSTVLRNCRTWSHINDYNVTANDIIKANVSHTHIVSDNPWSIFDFLSCLNHSDGVTVSFTSFEALTETIDLLDILNSSYTYKVVTHNDGLHNIHPKDKLIYSISIFPLDMCCFMYHKDKNDGLCVSITASTEYKSTLSVHANINMVFSNYLENCFYVDGVELNVPNNDPIPIKSELDIYLSLAKQTLTGIKLTKHKPKKVSKANDNSEMYISTSDSISDSISDSMISDSISTFISATISSDGSIEVEADGSIEVEAADGSVFEEVQQWYNNPKVQQIFAKSVVKKAKIVKGTPFDINTIIEDDIDL